MSRTLLNDLVHEQIVRAVRGGAPFQHASGMAGIGERTFYDWLSRGERYDLALESGLRADPAEEPFSRFRADVLSARAQCRVAAIATVTRAVVGEKDEAGAWVTFPDWKAAAWYLERTCPEEFGRRWRPESVEALSAEEELDALVARGLALLEEHAQPDG